MPPERRSQVAAAVAANTAASYSPHTSTSSLSGTPALAYTSRRNDDCSAYDEQVSKDLDAVGEKLLQQEPRADGGPRRPMNAFLIYARWRRMQMAKAREEHGGVKAEHEATVTELPPSPGGTVRKRKRKPSGTKPSDVSAALGEEWSKLSPEFQRPFHRKANELRAEFDAQHPEYKFTRGPKGVAKQRRLEKSMERAVIKKEGKGSSMSKSCASSPPDGQFRVRDNEAHLGSALDGFDSTFQSDNHSHFHFDQTSRTAHGSSSMVRAAGQQQQGVSSFEFYPALSGSGGDYGRYKRYSFADVPNNTGTVRSLPHLPSMAAPTPTWTQISPGRGHEKSSSRHSMADLGVAFDGRSPGRRPSAHFGDQTQLVGHTWPSTSSQQQVASGQMLAQTQNNTSGQQSFAYGQHLSHQYAQLPSSDISFPTLTQPDWPAPRANVAHGTSAALGWQGVTAAAPATSRPHAVEINQFHHSWPNISSSEAYTTGHLTFQSNWQPQPLHSHNNSALSLGTTPFANHQVESASWYAPSSIAHQPQASQTQSENTTSTFNPVFQHRHNTLTEQGSSLPLAQHQHHGMPYLGPAVQAHSRQATVNYSSAESVSARGSMSAIHAAHYPGSSAAGETSALFEQQSRTWGSTLTGNFPTFPAADQSLTWRPDAVPTADHARSGMHFRRHSMIQSESDSQANTEVGPRLPPIEGSNRSDLPSGSKVSTTSPRVRHLQTSEGEVAGGQLAAANNERDQGLGSLWPSTMPQLAQETRGAQEELLQVQQESSQEPRRSAPSQSHCGNAGEPQTAGLQHSEPPQDMARGASDQTSGSTFGFSEAPEQNDARLSSDAFDTSHTYELSLTEKYADPRKISTASGLPTHSSSSLAAIYESSGPHSAAAVLGASSSSAMSFSSPPWRVEPTSPPKPSSHSDPEGVHGRFINSEEQKSWQVFQQPEGREENGHSFATSGGKRGPQKAAVAPLDNTSLNYSDVSRAPLGPSLVAAASPEGSTPLFAARDGGLNSFTPGMGLLTHGHSEGETPFGAGHEPPGSLGSALEGLHAHSQDSHNYEQRLSSQGRERDAVLSSASLGMRESGEIQASPSSPVITRRGGQFDHSDLMLDSMNHQQHYERHRPLSYGEAGGRSDANAPPPRGSSTPATQHKHVNSISNVLDFWKSPVMESGWMAGKRHGSRSWEDDEYSERDGGGIGRGESSPVAHDSPSARPHTTNVRSSDGGHKHRGIGTENRGPPSNDEDVPGDQGAMQHGAHSEGASTSLSDPPESPSRSEGG